MFWSAGVVDFIRLANHISPNPIPTLIKPITIQLVEPSGLNAPQMNRTPKKIRIAAAM
jgi:hypothetical protein